MNCEGCMDGLVPFVASDNPKPDSAITVADLLFAVCLCPAGQALRNTDNNGRKVAPLWRVWCAKHQVDPSRVFMLENVYTAAQLAEAGVTRKRPEISREAALLAHGKAKR